MELVNFQRRCGGSVGKCAVQKNMRGEKRKRWGQLRTSVFRKKGKGERIEKRKIKFERREQTERDRTARDRHPPRRGKKAKKTRAWPNQKKMVLSWKSSFLISTATLHSTQLERQFSFRVTRSWSINLIIINQYYVNFIYWINIGKVCVISAKISVKVTPLQTWHPKFFPSSKLFGISCSEIIACCFKKLTKVQYISFVLP